MNNLYILSGYNNYYNRIVKQEYSISDYMTKAINTYSLEGVNFNPNDGVNTTQIIGYGSTNEPYLGDGDYLVVQDENTSEIVSRWFITENQRNLSGQYTCVLRRDLVADHYDEILDAPMYIEKATVQDDDPAIYNNEGVSVNQIKTKEYLLKDETECAWIVGYIDREFKDPPATNENGEIELTSSVPIPDIITDVASSEWPDLRETGFSQTDFQIYVPVIIKNTKNKRSEYCLVYDEFSDRWGFNDDNTFDNFYGYTITGGDSITNTLFGLIELLNNSSPLIGDTMKQATRMYARSTPDADDENRYNLFNSRKGWILKATDGYFRMDYSNESEPIKIEVISDILETYIKTVFTDFLHANYPVSNKPSIYVTYTNQYVKQTLEAVSLNSLDTAVVKFPSSENRTHLNDAPYDMFCIPYTESNSLTIYCEGIDPSSLEAANKQDSFLMTSNIITLSLAQQLAEKLGKNLYDLQLLPFCPISGFEKEGNTLSWFNITTKDYTLITSKREVESNTKAVIFWCSSSQDSFDIPLNIPIDNKKMNNECDMYRLTSSNYNGQFEFRSAKINGIKKFNVDYTYLPYSPYIHINPNFEGLYGEDFNDARGLICQGDFSISYESDRWIDYQIQNKNYANTFNRQIQNMETTQDVQRKQQVFNAVTGTIMGGAAGVVAGSKGGIPGMIAGGIVGTAASAVGGALDVHYGDILRAEALDYTKDMFNYQLDNIKAMPDSLAKVTAFTNNNKIFPILEYYTCTPTEKRAIANKIAWNGMTVMRIGTINEFINNSWTYENITSKNYIKGKLIRLDSVKDDYHKLNALSGELNQGLYFE